MNKTLTTIVPNSLRRLLLGGAIAVLLAACGGGSVEGPDAEALRVKVLPTQADAFTLQLLHVAELPSAGTWLENPFVYDAAAREIQALAAHGGTEIVSQRHALAHDGEPVVVHLVFRRLT